MKRTSPGALALLALGGIVLSFLIEQLIASSGKPIIVPPISLALTLVALGVVVFLLAWPIRRAIRSKVAVHIDPFRALRVAVLAKASSLAGALLAGAGVGLVVYLLSRQTTPPSSTLWLAVSTAVGAVVLLAAGLIAEHFCVLPPDDTDPEREAQKRTEPGAEQAHGSHA